MNILMVKQVKAIKNGIVEQCVRFNHKTSILYHQNRSKDVEMDIDEFLVLLGKTIDIGKEKGFKVIVNDVAENSKWI